METSVFKTAAVVGSTVAILECAQIALPSRVVALTEVILATVGAGGGVVAFRLVRAYLVSERSTVQDRVLFNVELGESQSAPSEQPSRRPSPVGDNPARFDAGR